MVVSTVKNDDSTESVKEDIYYDKSTDKEEDIEALNTNKEPNDSNLELTEQHSSEKVSEQVEKLRKWLNKTFRIEMSDGRVLIGVFMCTDRDQNIILGSCSEFFPNKKTPDGTETVTKTTENLDPPEEPRVLGLVMVPGKHIVSIHLDELSVIPPQDSEESDDFMCVNVT